jgi:hypothetical protein
MTVIDGQSAPRGVLSITVSATSSSSLQSPHIAYVAIAVSLLNVACTPALVPLVTRLHEHFAVSLIVCLADT